MRGEEAPESAAQNRTSASGASRNAWRATRDAVDRVPTLALVFALVALHVALHARWLNLPPAGFHLWRQTQTLSVARNFHEEDFDLVRPRVDARGAKSGITGMEFPLVNAAIAAAYRAFGFHQSLHRAVMLVLSLPAILGMMTLARALLGSQTMGFLAAALLVGNPLFVYYSMTALPDVPMLGPLLLGLTGLVVWSRAPRTAPLLGGIAGLTLAGLVKVSSAVAWPAAVVLLWEGLRRATTRQRTLALVTATAGICVVATWYAWAHHLSDASGNHTFLLRPRFPYPIAIVPRALRKVVLGWLPEVYAGYPQLVLAAIGLPALARATPAPTARMLAAWGLGIAAFAVAMLPQLGVHDYYMAPATPALLLVATCGFGRVSAAAETERATAWIAALLLVAVVVIGPYRGLSRFARADPSPDLLAIESDLRGLLPDDDALVIAASDPSPSIFLYFMHRKGWNVQEQLGAQRLGAMIGNGARYLVSDSRRFEGRPEVAPHLRFVGTSGRFRIFALNR